MTPLRGRPAAGFIPDVDFLRLKQLVIARTGHFYYQDKDALLWERVRRRLHDSGLRGVEAYLARLEDPALGEAEWAALEAEITIGETFFFRYAEQFAALRETILPDILARNRARRRMRFWSAGCASGAEPYSLAILLRQLLGEALPEWRIGLLGTDLNESVLQQARRGLYSRWALRALQAEEIARDFTPAGDGQRWALRPQHRALVRFERQNLLSLLDGVSPLQMTEFDLILCRNVLIYFHPEVVERIVRALAERLSEGGWLLLGHAEPNPAFAEFLDVVSLPGTVAYRRPGAGAIMLPAPPAVLLPVPDAPAVPLPEPPPPEVSASPSPRSVPGPAAEAPAPPQEEERDASRHLQEARARADGGDLAGARAACRAGLALDPLCAPLHYYEGLIARSLGENAVAEAAFRRTLYLRGDFGMAHYQLGLLLLDEGRGAAGRRALATAAGLAAALPAGAVLEEGDGMTARQLLDMARLHLEAPATAKIP